MSQNKHAEARELMYSGALLFFSHGQQNSAADLSMLVLESLEKSEAKVTDELLGKLGQVFSLMDQNSPERVALYPELLGVDWRIRKIRSPKAASVTGYYTVERAKLL
ncbi:hypothetical protein GDO81_016808 [Engystomops pustulosus]|uniref:Uncharacterized protein n=1 Tax=Engystomops pustulosus TaxID=76066 RepID=A0AAV7A9F5_ENGPU|nr:hypothetical protein GDO81_016808 [Engystomops pustulosus]